MNIKKLRMLLPMMTMIFLSAGSNAFAHIDVVYPKIPDYKVQSESVFFLGSTSENADFYINEKQVILREGGIFVHVVPLKYGKNIIKMISKHDNETEELIYSVTREKPAAKKNAKEIFEPKKAGIILQTETIKDFAPVRVMPSDNAARAIDLPERTPLYIAGRIGKYYKIDAETNDNKTHFWIDKSFLGSLKPSEDFSAPQIKYMNKYSDKYYDYTEFLLTRPVFYTLKQNENENEIELALYGIKTKDGQNYKYIHKQQKPILGYDAYFETKNKLVLKTAKTPKIKNKKKPLQNIKIFIDPGHGGDEQGAIGPSRICEKDINLEISRYLEHYLKKDGADPIMSRRHDVKTGLYERAAAAKKHNALISISIHNNALSDGKDPYKQHGIEVHYYNENAKPLAEIILKDLVSALNIKDNGVHKSSFVMTRSTSPVSVLVECAYMIHPDEYLMLIKPEKQKEIAFSIKESLKKYIEALQKKTKKAGGAQAEI